MAEENYWHDLRQEGVEPADAMLYCLRSSSERLELHRQAVIDALVNLRIYLKVDKEEEVCIGASKRLDLNEELRVHYLFEELTCLNEALSWDEKIDLCEYDSLGEFIEQLKESYLGSLRENDYEVTRGLIDNIAKLAASMKTADKENKVLYGSERKSLDKLLTFVEQQKELFKIGHGRIALA